MTTRAPVQGRLLADFERGTTIEHPWDVTVDPGAIALFQAAFLDPTPTFASTPWARALSFRDRPIHPFQLLCYALSFSTHDVAAIADVGFEDVRFPTACYPGETLRAWSEVLEVSEPSHDRGIVTLRTVLETAQGHAVCTVTRRALVPDGHNERRPRAPWPKVEHEALRDLPRLPEALRDRVVLPDPRFGFAGFQEDFAVGDTLVHPSTLTVDASTASQLASLARCTRNQGIPGALVACFSMALAARETAGNALWDLGIDDATFGAPVSAGDVLHVTSRVTGAEDHDERTGVVTFRIATTRGVSGAALLDRGIDPFEQEIPERVCVLSRSLLLRKRPGRISLGG